MSYTRDLRPPMGSRGRASGACMGGDGRARRAEPSLGEMLDDPVVAAVMRRDHVTRDDLIAVVEAARAGLRQRRESGEACGVSRP